MDIPLCISVTVICVVTYPGSWTVSPGSLAWSGPWSEITLLARDPGPGFHALLHEPKTRDTGPCPACLST